MPGSKAMNGRPGARNLQSYHELFYISQKEKKSMKEKNKLKREVMMKFLLPLQNLSRKFLDFLSKLKSMKRNSTSQPLIFFKIGRKSGLRREGKQREIIIYGHI